MESAASASTAGRATTTLRTATATNTLIGVAGDDTLVGGGGRDKADYSARTNPVDFDLNTALAGDAKVTSLGETDTLALIVSGSEDGFDPLSDIEVFIGSTAADNFRLNAL